MGRIAKYAASAGACLLFTVYVLYHILSGFGKSVKLFTVQADTFSETVSEAGYIFRNAETLYSGNAGTRGYIYENGAKVAAGSTVAKIFVYSNDEATRQLDIINENIRIYTEAAVRAGESSAKVDEEIERLHERIAAESASGDVTAMKKYAHELAVMTSKRALLTDGISDYKSDIAILESRKALIENSLGHGYTPITAARSGYYYHLSDGLDSSFGEEAVMNLTADGFDLLGGLTASAANTAGALVYSPKWYFALKTESEVASGLSAGKSYSCRFTDNTHTDLLEMKLERKEKSADGRSYLLVLSCSLLPEDFDFTRKQNIVITARTYEGYKIPLSSVRISRDTGKPYVYIFRKGFVAVREVTPVFEKDGYFIIEKGGELRLYDRLIIGEADLWDGKMIE